MKSHLIIAMLCIAYITYANQPKEIIPFEVINGHIRVDLSLNDSEPLSFVFDTGAAANFLNDKTAKALGLDQDGNMYIQGAAGTSQMKLAKGTSFSIGKMKFHDQTFAVMDLGHMSSDDDPLDGVIGASILTQYVVEIDYDQKEIRLHDNMDGIETADHSEFKYSLTPFNIPIIESTLELDNGEKITGKYFVDTGAALSIMFNSNLVRKYDLLNTMGDNYPMTSTSLSTKETDHVSLVPKFTLFDHQFEDFSVRLSQATQGVNSFQGYDGIIGFYLLSRFNTIFDYANQRMFIKPNSSFSNPFPRNYSGLQVEKTKGNYRVINVARNSAGDDAKIKEGDIITSLDGKNANSIGDFSRYFQNAEGQISVGVKRNGESFKVTITPRSTIN